MALESKLLGNRRVHGSSTLQYDLFDIAQGISDSANYEIIDSYSSASTPNRYKGDPIADAVWTSGASVGAYNSWIIIQPVAPTYSPAWQLKLQSLNSGGSFDDPSGHDYGYEGYSNGTIYSRFSPLGGWDLADTNPDFTSSGVDPVNGVSGNTQTYTYSVSAGVGQPGNYFMTADEDTLFLFTRVMVADWVFTTVFGYYGDYLAKSASQQGSSSRCMITTNGFFSTLSFDLLSSPSLIDETDPVGTLNSYVWFVLPDGVGKKSLYTTLPLDSTAMTYSQPNKMESPNSYDLFPILIRPLETEFPGFIGSLRLLAKTYAPGRAIKMQGGAWLSITPGYSAVVKWDGSVRPY